MDDTAGKTYNLFNNNVNNGAVNERPVFDAELQIKSGRLVQVEMRCIDPASYLYFYSLSQTVGGGPGGGATPANPPTNIQGEGVLGIFEAYTTQTMSRQVP